MEIVEFLTQRLGEDEARARLALQVIGGRWNSWEVVSQQLHACCDTITNVGCVGQHLHRNADPARMLREVEAKRRIIDEHDTRDWKVGDRVHDCQWEQWPCNTLRLLALPHADHADYRDEWRL